MIYRVSQLKLPIEHKENDLYSAAAKACKVGAADIIMLKIVKQSIDARDKSKLLYVYTVDLEIKKKLNLSNHSKVELVNEKKYRFPEAGDIKLNKAPVVCGLGPAGMFCALFLARSGFKPIVFERGQSVDERVETVNEFWKNGNLNIASNVQFGEGGAGTFSDGKLNTLVKDKFGRNKLVLETLVEHGAKEEIIYVNKPHIGTDELCNIVRNIRNEILDLGGQIYFDSQIVDVIIKDKAVRSIIVKNNNQERNIETDILVLACGHSARDTFYMLKDRQVSMEPKSFAVGFRVMHPQAMINEAQYGKAYMNKLPAAPYKVTAKTRNGRGVYSFCMCPGGYVVNASSEEGMLAVNGMSYSGRDSSNANSAIIVTVSPDDYGDMGVLSGVEFQRSLEKKAFELCKGKVPIQLFGDFKNNIASKQLGDFKPCIKGGYELTNLRSILPEEMNLSLIEGMEQFGKTIKGFDRYDSILAGVESRTSSPVRIIRNENGQSNIQGLYPCGEGAGYAGGITSAAMDGVKIAEYIVSSYHV